MKRQHKANIYLKSTYIWVVLKRMKASRFNDKLIIIHNARHIPLEPHGSH